MENNISHKVPWNVTITTCWRRGNTYSRLGTRGDQKNTGLRLILDKGKQEEKMLEESLLLCFISWLILLTVSKKGKERFKPNCILLFRWEALGSYHLPKHAFITSGFLLSEKFLALPWSTPLQNWICFKTMFRKPGVVSYWCDWFNNVPLHFVYAALFELLAPACFKLDIIIWSISVGSTLREEPKWAEMSLILCDRPAPGQLCIWWPAITEPMDG